jgi:hypothetical protein
MGAKSFTGAILVPQVQMNARFLTYLPFVGLIAGLAVFQQLLLWVSPVESEADVLRRLMFVALLAPLGLVYWFRTPRLVRFGEAMNPAVTVVISAVLYRLNIWDGGFDSVGFLVISSCALGAILGVRALLPFSAVFLFLGAVETRVRSDQLASGDSTPLSDAGLVLALALPSALAGVLLGIAITRVGARRTHRGGSPTTE